MTKITKSKQKFGTLLQFSGHNFFLQFLIFQYIPPTSCAKRNVNYIFVNSDIIVNILQCLNCQSRLMKRNKGKISIIKYVFEYHCWMKIEIMTEQYWCCAWSLSAASYLRLPLKNSIYILYYGRCLLYLLSTLKLFSWRIT